jgi:hypothetical protein
VVPAGRVVLQKLAGSIRFGARWTASSTLNLASALDVVGMDAVGLG